MVIGRVVGNIVATIKHELYQGSKILLVQPLATDRKTAMGNTMVAVDTVGAGIGEMVMVATEGKAASEIIGVPRGPIRSIIVGILDGVSQQS
ncbi:MAG: EutN/CcmL family microcompartment protein [Candidatus Latescibacteria bacterium]|jgi:ethanolamine utilization protein EutN|nr:EutN/CcmL family microcompartment protein [Candidatus Latescibacterota bacterium]